MSLNSRGHKFSHMSIYRYERFDHNSNIDSEPYPISTLTWDQTLDLNLRINYTPDSRPYSQPSPLTQDPDLTLTRLNDK